MRDVTVVMLIAMPRKTIWAGRIIGALVILFLTFDGLIKAMRLAPAVESTAQIGFPERLVRSLGFVELACLALYTVPRTSVLGAILLTGYLGGATAAKVRLEDPSFLFSVVFGVLVWGALFLRDDRLRALIPLKKDRLSRGQE